MLAIKHYIIIKICKNTIYDYKRTLNNTLFCVFSREIFGRNKLYYYLCNRKTETKYKHLKLKSYEKVFYKYYHSGRN